jgi:hypothetical protein
MHLDRTDQFITHTFVCSFTLSQPKLRCIVADGTRPDTRLLLLSDQAEMPEGVGVLV